MENNYITSARKEFVVISYAKEAPKYAIKKSVINSIPYQRTSTPKLPGKSTSDLSEEHYKKWCAHLHEPPVRIRLRGCDKAPKGIISGHLDPKQSFLESDFDISKTKRSNSYKKAMANKSPVLHSKIPPKDKDNSEITRTSCFQLNIGFLFARVTNAFLKK